MAEFREVLRPDGNIDYVNVRYDEIIANTPTEPEPLPDGFVAPTADELAQNEWASVRQYRNALLAETDWWANSDITMTTEQTVYRQRLRDITDEFSSVESVEWPTLGQEVWPTPPFQPGT